MAVVRIMTGGREFRREIGSRLIVGRDAECDVRVDDPKISRLHCLIERKGDEYVAVDLDSHNGTMISGWPLTRQTLKHGDVLDMGVASLQFLMEAERKTAREAEALSREEMIDRQAQQASGDVPDPASIPRRGPARRKASLWEHAMRASEPVDPKSRKRKRVKPEVLRKQLLEARNSSSGVSEPIRVVRPAGSLPWYYTSVPWKVGIPASLLLLAILYVIANGMPHFGSMGGHSPPKSLPHSSPYNND